MGALQYIGYAILTAMILIGIGGTVLNMTTEEYKAVEHQFQNKPSSTMIKASFYAFALTSLAPAWEPEFLGRKWFIPFPDSTDLIPIALFILASFFFIKRMTVFQTNLGILYTALFYIITIPLIWALWKLFVYYFMFQYCGQAIGLTKHQITTALQNLLNATETNKNQLIAITAISSTALLTTIFGKNE